MLGPLPRLYQVLVAAVAVALFVGAGIWAAVMLPYPTLVSVGASIGLVVGAVCAFLLVHESRRATESSSPRRPHLR